MRLERGALVLVAIACLGPVAPASATPAWLAPVDVSASGQNANPPQVATDAQGNAIAVWSRSNGTNDIVQAAVRAAGGAWQVPVDLSAVDQDAFEPQVAVDPQGNAIAVWLRSNGTNDIVQAAARPAGGTWSAPVNLSAALQNAISPQVTVDAQGNAVAVWHRSNGVNDIVQAASRAAGGAWEPPVDLSLPGQNARFPQVAVDPQGNAVAVWSRLNAAHYIVQAAERPGGGAWSAPVDLSVGGQSAQFPQVAVDAQGDAVAIWERSDGANDIVQAVERPAGGAWSAPVALSVGGYDVQRARLAIDPQGTAVAVWERYNGSYQIVQASTRAEGGTWLAPADLSANGKHAQFPQVAIDPQGNSIAIWYRDDGSNFIVQAARRTAGGTWQAPVDVSAPGQDAELPQVAIDPEGNAVAVWQHFDGTNYIARAAGYDAVGPLIGGLSVPLAGTAGVPVALSVSPFDWWSPLGATTWMLGDGSTASGTQITYTYVNAGTYAVNVRAEDALGNFTNAMRVITIAPAGSPPPTQPPPTTPPTTPPTVAALTQLRLAPKSFRAAGSGPAVKTAAVRVGTRVSYHLNAATAVRFTIERARFGRRVGKRCVKQTRGNRRAPRCTRNVSLPGRFARDRPSGTDRFTFTGRLRGRALKPGRYRLVATPAGGKPARAGFRIVR